MTPPPFLHDASGDVRFEVLLDDGASIGASISMRALHYRYRASLDGADAVATYTAHRGDIDAAVRRRFAAGSLEPVMLREHDLKA
jgi:hypothetical protein